MKKYLNVFLDWVAVIINIICLLPVIIIGSPILLISWAHHRSKMVTQQFIKNNKEKYESLNVIERKNK
jgi:hypothetical protein